MLEWYHLLFLTIWISIMRLPHSLIWVGYGYLLIILFWYYSGLYIMQELSHLGEIALVSIWFRISSSQMETQAYKNSLTLTYPPNINIWPVLQFWYPHVSSLIPCFHLHASPLTHPQWDNRRFGKNEAPPSDRGCYIVVLGSCNKLPGRNLQAILRVPINVRGNFWAQSIEILVFQVQPVTCSHLLVLLY